MTGDTRLEVHPLISNAHRRPYPTLLQRRRASSEARPVRIPAKAAHEGERSGDVDMVCLPADHVRPVWFTQPPSSPPEAMP